MQRRLMAARIIMPALPTTNPISTAARWYTSQAIPIEMRLPDTDLALLTGRKTFEYELFRDLMVALGTSRTYQGDIGKLTPRTPATTFPARNRRSLMILQEDVSVFWIFNIDSTTGKVLMSK